MSLIHQLRLMFDRFDVEPRPLQEWAYNTSKNEKNLVIVAPTGSGKTEAAYLASKNWGRTTYALPMKTLANDINKRLTTYERNVSGEDWTVQHSSINDDRRLANDYSVSTIDQVLTGYFGFGREAFIRGKNVMRNHLILDEVQLFDPERALLSLLSMLEQTTAEPFNNHFCMMTATFPTVLHEYLEKRFNTEVYIERTPPIKKDVTLEWVNNVPLHQIIACQNKQIVSCNTQRQQVDLYNSLIKNGVHPDRLVVLNSRLYPEDRAEAEEAVHAYFGKGSPENNKILLATQIIEAGMDISARQFYSYEAPIDSLIQREGRCARWGGEGIFTVMKQPTINGQHPVYDDDLIERTTALVKAHSGERFAWETQLAWVDEVLNPLYESILNSKRKRYLFKDALQNGGAQSLIREIESVNVIPVDFSSGVSDMDFERHSISLSLHSMKGKNFLRPSTSNEDYALQTGDTVLIDATEWSYDTCGLRYGTEAPALNAPYADLSDLSESLFEDYIDETLEEHLEETASQLVDIIHADGLIPDKTADYDVWTIGAGHDIGKGTVPWQAMIRWNGDGTYADADTLYAHRPWIPRDNSRIRGLKHALVGTVLLDDQLTFIEKNVIMSHHGRLMPAHEHHVNATKWMKEVNAVLASLGFSLEPDETKSFAFSEDDFITPAHSEWGLMVYLTGALMQADRQAIRAVKNRKETDAYIAY